MKYFIFRKDQIGFNDYLASISSFRLIIPIALVLCSDKSTELVELLDLEKDNIHVAKYLTKMPPKEILEKKLKEAIINAKQLLELKKK